jgi:thioredoxin-like negative regulator of GroEL
MSIHEVTSVEDYALQLKTSQPVVVQCHAAFCRQCKPLGKKLERLSEELTGVKFLRVDLGEEDLQEEVGESLGVKSLPFFGLVLDGKKVGEQYGSKWEKVEEKVRAHAASVPSSEHDEPPAKRQKADETGATADM